MRPPRSLRHFAIQSVIDCFLERREIIWEKKICICRYKVALIDSLPAGGQVGQNTTPLVVSANKRLMTHIGAQISVNEGFELTFEY